MILQTVRCCVQLNLGLCNIRKKRLREITQVTVMSNNNVNGKKVCIERVPETSNYNSLDTGNLTPQQAPENSMPLNVTSSNMLGTRARNLVAETSASSLPAVSQSHSRQDMMVSYPDNMSLYRKRENQDGQLSPLSNFNKRSRLTPVGLDGIQRQQIDVPYADGYHDMNWKNTLLQQEAIIRGIQYPNLEKLEAETNQLDQQKLFQQSTQQAFMRSGFPQSPWTNNNSSSLTQSAEKDPRKEDQFQKKKSVQSPLSSKSGEFSSGSLGLPHSQYETPAVGSLQKDKSAVTGIGGTLSITSSGNDSVQRQHQVQIAQKRRTNSLPKTPAMSGVGSPASVGTMSIPMNANSPSVGTPPLADQTILQRFSKIEMALMRY